MKREQRQARALNALAVTGSYSAAARMSGISRRTLYNYLHDPQFVRELEKMHNGIIIEQRCDLDDMREHAEDVLAELLEDPSPAIRIKAAKVVLDNANRREAEMVKIFERQNRKDEKNLWWL